MKTLLLSTAILLVTAGFASAADAIISEPVASFNWSGIYLGGALGGASIRGNDESYGEGSERDTGFAGAGYVGYNWQFGQVVAGIEADFGANGAEVDDDDYLLPLEEEYGGTIRARIGYAFNNFLPYVTGGYAVSRFQNDHEGDGDSEDFARETVDGYVIGGGLEWGATQHLIVRAEYLFSDFGTNGFDHYDGDVHDIDIEKHDFRIGLAYKF